MKTIEERWASENENTGFQILEDVDEEQQEESE